MSDISISIRKINNIENGILVDINGPINIHTIQDFQTMLRPVFNQKSYKLLMNMANVKYIDSTGVGCFLEMIDTEKIEWNRLVLANMSSYVKHVFETLDITSFFKITNTVEDGLKFLQKPQI